MAIIDLTEPHAVEASMCKMGQKPIESVLEDAFFFDRFLGFVEKYDEVFGKQALPTAEQWVLDKDYSAISSFLKPSVNESFFSVAYHELSTMSLQHLEQIKLKAQKIAPVLDEQKALYEELMNAYKIADSSDVSSWRNDLTAWMNDDLFN